MSSPMFVIPDTDEAKCVVCGKPIANQQDVVLIISNSDDEIWHWTSYDEEAEPSGLGIWDYDAEIPAHRACLIDAILQYQSTHGIQPQDWHGLRK